MRSHLLPLLQNEVAKAARRKLPYFGFFAAGLGCVILYFVGGQLGVSATANGWGYVAFSMQMLFADIGPISILVFSAMLLSEETGTGTIRAALAAPVHRWELYVAKATAGLFYAAAFSAVALLFSVGLGLIHHNFGPIGDSFGVVYDRSKAIQESMLGYALSWIPLAALVMCGLLISTLVRSPGAAVAVAISSLILIDFTKHLMGIDPYIFTRYIGYSWAVLQQGAQGMEYQWTPEVWKMILLSGISAAVAFTTGLIVFVRQDLNH